MTSPTSPNKRFVQTDTTLIRADQIERIDLQRFATHGEITLHYPGGSSRTHGNYAIEALLLLKPSSLEGTSVRWIRRAWLQHNLLGHPLMQLLALLGFHGAAIAIHDRTIPGRDKLRPSSS